MCSHGLWEEVYLFLILCYRFSNFGERIEQNRKKRIGRYIMKREHRVRKIYVNKQQSSDQLHVYLISYPTVRARFMDVSSMQLKGSVVGGAHMWFKALLMLF